MCGIAGIWKLNGEIVSQETLVRFTDSLQHRGPDGAGYYIDDNNRLGLGHRRLSILDLSDDARQPMTFQDRYYISYNGEIFNFIELRNELKQKGYNFKSDSDTEVILAAYHLWGKDCLLKFNGMWAFAIWDKQKEELFLARDRFGIKPLYYLNLPDIFAFASETYAFKFLNGFKREINKGNLSRVLQKSTSLEGIGYTIFNDIYQLLPGHYLHLSKNKKLQQRRWWSTLENFVQVPVSYKEQTEHFCELFKDSCKLRMRSDVSIASALSGGLDSSAVYCMLHHMMKNNPAAERIPENWQKAFVAVFPGTTQDERVYAEEVINYTMGKVTYITPDYKNLASDIISSTKKFDSITLTPILIANNIYSSMQEEGIKVSMDGHGVDEMLFGYTSMIPSVYSVAQHENDEAYTKDILDTYANMFPESEREKALNTLITTGERITPSLQRRIINKIKSLIKKPKHTESFLYDVSRTQLPSLTDKETDLKHLNAADKVLYENFHVTMLPSILKNFDRASMQSSIEVRMPFMDWRLVAFVFSLPLKSKIGNGYTKRILRDSMQGIMPETIRTRTLKTGLNAPLAEWFGGLLKDFVLDHVNSRDFQNSEIWNGKYIAALAKEKIKNNSWTWSDSTRVWSYINAYLLLENENY